VPYVVGLCTKSTPQASQAGTCSMPWPIDTEYSAKVAKYLAETEYSVSAMLSEYSVLSEVRNSGFGRSLINTRAISCVSF
jgi:hypothetical protein